MLGECLEVFREKLEDQGEDVILDDYILKDGTYVIVGKNGEIISVTEMKLDKKTGHMEKSAIRYRDFCYYDYHSDLISMNKPQDPAKIIHSNNYLSFWVKKDSVSNGKLTPEVIEKYYEVLEHPEKKYEKSKAVSIYQNVEETLGKVDMETLRRNKSWILSHIFAMEEVCEDIDMSRKDYLKIFFEADREAYDREGKRYLIPNIYNSNQYNVEINGKIYGLPDNNQGMNSKKPFLSIKTRKTAAPYLLNQEEVILQKQFFDYLMNFAACGKNNIYIDLNKRVFCACGNSEFPPGAVSGFFIRIQKGKEVEILDQDVVPFLDNHLDRPFEYKNVLGVADGRNPEHEQQYHEGYEKREELEGLINEIFFSKILINNYFSPKESIRIMDEGLKRSLLLYRRKIFSWLHLGNEAGMKQIMDKVSLELIKSSILNGYMGKAVRQINLRISILEYLSKGGENMGDFSIELYEGLKKKLTSEENAALENDREYYFAVGQMAGYFVYLSKVGKKMHSMINPFLNARENRMIKDRLQRYYKKYNYAISLKYKKVGKLYAMLMGYEPEGEVMQDIIMIGFAMSNLLLEKEEKEHE